MESVVDCSRGFAWSQRARRAVDQPISYLMGAALADPKLISLAAGFVDFETLPAEEISGLVGSVLGEEESARAALQYGETAGLGALREAVYEYVAKLDGRSAQSYPGSAEQVVISTGSQQLLHILADLLIDAGDIVITAWPSYFVYTAVLESFGAVVRTVEMDEKGMEPRALDGLLGELAAKGELGRVKIVYVCSYHQNPTGLTLAEERRGQVLEVVRKWSREQRILLIEDAAYRELTYEGQGLGSIKRHDAGNEQVALLGTFSKPLAPGLKTGYGLLPADLAKAVLLEKGGRDFGSANLCQHVLYRALKEGVFEKHVARLREAYAVKCRAMLEALEEHVGGLMGGGIRWTRPTGGLYVWMTLPEGVDTGRGGPLFSRALDLGVLFVPGEFCYPNDAERVMPRNTIRLSFGVPTVEQIRCGVGRLAEAIKAVAG